MSRCEAWLAATMKLVCCGMWLAPRPRCQHALVEHALRPASPRLPARRHRDGTWISVVVARRAWPPLARRRDGPAREQLVQLGDGPQRGEVELSGSTSRRSRARSTARRTSGCRSPARRTGCRAARRRGAAPTRSRPSRGARRPGPPSPAAASAPVVSSRLRRRRAISAATSRRLTERLAVLGRSPSQKCTPLTRFQNGRSAETLRKCSSILAVTSAADSAGRARGRAPPRRRPARRCRRARPPPTAP